MRIRRAFTVVELLVVIGIIGVLVSILLPAISKTREQARSVVCQSSIRQIGHSVFLYVAENKGVLPDPYNSVARPWPGSAIQVDGPGQYNWQTGTLWPYIASRPDLRRRIFNCPSDNAEPRHPRDGNFVADLLHPRNFSYNFNPKMWRDPNTRGQSVSLMLTQVRRPSNKLMVLEEQDPMGPGGTISAAVPDVTPGSQVACFLTTRHNKLANVGFFDGHVESMDPLVFANSQSYVYTPTYAHYVDLLVSR